MSGLRPPKGSRVAVALSGGVDSSVAAAELQTTGYEVVGFFMRNWSAAIDASGYCPWVEDVASARLVAHQLQIPLYVLDFEEIYKQEVIKPFFAGYRAGLTPNPDVLCNQFIKFGAFWQTVQEYDCQFMATGHYAQITDHGNQPQLLRGVDPAKDQSYFLWTLQAEVLRHLILPIGNRPKAAIRTTAKQLNLPTATRPDSQGICFIGKVSVRQFLAKELGLKPGPVMTADGQVIGQHQGLHFATIGQRHGTGSSGTGVPLYVAKKEPAMNSLVVVPEGHHWLVTDRFSVHGVKTTSTKPLPREVNVVIRYHHPAVSATLTPTADGYIVKLDRPERAVTPGQSAVFYSPQNPDQLLGGGIISA